jgi:hypothetical protein
VRPTGETPRALVEGARGADARGTPRSRLTLDLSNDMVPRHCADRRSVRY